MNFTKRNIEDWDFRGVQPGTEADYFLWSHYPEVVAVDSFRAVLIAGAVEDGLAKVSEDREYIVPVSDSEFWRGRDGVLETRKGTFEMRREVFSDSKFEMFDGYMKARLRDRLTRSGRFESRVRSSLWREWKKYARVKVRLLSNEEELEEYRRTIKDGAAAHRKGDVGEADGS